MTAENAVQMTLESGVAPLELRYTQINDCYKKSPVAYRTETLIHSVELGTLTFSKYKFAADGTETGLALARWNVREAMRAIRRFEAAGRKIRFISVRCPAALATDVELYDWMLTLMREENFHSPEKLCLEFPMSVLFRSASKVSFSLLNMKLLKVGTMLAGCASRECPVTKLIDLPFDYVLLDPTMTRLITSRDKSTVIVMLLQYLRSMRVNVIGEGVSRDDQITALNRGDCVGYIPAAGYRGSVSHGGLSMTVDEAMAQREEED